VDTVPFTHGDLNSNLVNSVWAGNTPRLGDWLTITFRPEGKVIMSFSIDNTSNEWEYTFDEAENAGDIIIPPDPDPDPEAPEPWHPAPNGFTVSGNILTITNYGFHGGNPREFRRYR
jgi:hypothetical protein